MHVSGYGCYLGLASNVACQACLGCEFHLISQQLQNRVASFCDLQVAFFVESRGSLISSKILVIPNLSNLSLEEHCGNLCPVLYTSCIICFVRLFCYINDRTGSTLLC